MLEQVKNALRIDDDAFDAEIKSLIETAEEDLASSGVSSSASDKSIYKSAIVFFCKGHFGYDNPDKTGFIEAYEILKTKASIIYCGEE